MKKNGNAIGLNSEELPEKWYNIIPDLSKDFPGPKDPEDGPSRLKNLEKIFSKGILDQEMSKERFIEIPEEVRDLYAQAGRPHTLYRAERLEEKLDTPAKLYYKSEFYSPTGSHKVNTAIPQAYMAKQEGKTKMTTETGAGQWGTALAYACSLIGLDLDVYWVKAAASWKSDRRDFMKLYGANVFDSPSERTEIGRKILEERSDHPGSLGIAISEAVEKAKEEEETVYGLGSVLNHVLLHQTIIGLETKKQLEKVDEYPDTVISCLGGGSNFGGISLPFMGDSLRDGKDTSFIAAQSQAAPNMNGEYCYDFGDYAEQTPLLKMYTLGYQADLEAIKADGLRYHAAAPILSFLRKKGMIDTIIYPKDEEYVFERAKLFLREEGFLPAPESAYSVAAAIDQAEECKRKNEEKTILFNISGHGYMDMQGYREKLVES